jgi:hypothetical protein
MWVGLTGAFVNLRGLLPQIGTESDCIGGIKKYRVVYELAGRTDQAGGDPWQRYSVDVESGRTVTATVIYDANRSEFTGKVDAPGQKSVVWSLTDYPRADFSVATAHAMGVCILERNEPQPTNFNSSGLAKFDSASFSQCRVDGTSVAAPDETFQFPMDGDRVLIADAPDPKTGAFQYQWQNH